MIKLMKLQKAVVAIVLGVLALIAFIILNGQDIEWSKYILELSGLFLMAGALLFFYPIFFGRKDKEGCVELDPDVVIDVPAEKTDQPV